MSRMIDADDLLTAFPIGDEPTVTIACIRATIKHMPTIEERKTGRWKAIHEITPFSNPDSITFVCSECGHKRYTLYGFPWHRMNFCPNCGADMRGCNHETP